MQAVSLKVGDTYSADYVNNLYKQLLTFDKNCRYYCLTDNKKGLNSNIEIINITDDYNERKWWNKTKLFEPGLFDQPTLYLDLDCYIHTDPSPFFKDSATDKLNVLKTFWFSDDMATKIHQCTVNTSVMVIDEHNCEKLWRDYNDNKERIFKSFYGLDPWLYRRHKDNINYFKPGIAYSYKHGCHFPGDIQVNTLRQIPVCIFDDALDRYEVLNGLWQNTRTVG